MKKLLALILAMAMMLAMVAGCSSSSSSDSSSSSSSSDAAAEEELETYNFDLGVMFYDPAATPDFNTDGTTTQYFADLVEERSGGRITITVHWASILGGTTELFDQVRSGDLDMMFGGALSSNDVRFGMFAVPGIADDADMAADLFANPDSDMYAIVDNIYAENNVKLLGASYGQFRGIFNNTREIHLPEDCEGMMLRAYADEVVTTYWNGLCNTTVMSIADVYTGLQLGTVDGLEFWPTAMISNGYTDVLTYYSDILWQWQSNTNLVMNMDLFNSLDAEAQEIMLECAQEAAGVFYRETEEASIVDAYTYMEENGIQIYTLTDEERAAWTAYADSLQDEFRDIVGAEIYDEVMAVVDEYRANR